MPFAKGGEYSPYCADLHLVVDWEDEGRRLRSFARSRGESESRTIRSESQYFRPGLTWSRRSQKGFSVRPVPGGAIFGEKGPTIFVPSDAPEDLDRLMAYLNSGLAAALLEATVAFGAYEVGAVQRLPLVDPGFDGGSAGQALTRIRTFEGERLETDHRFTSPWTKGTADADAALQMSRQVDEVVSRAAGEIRAATPLSAMYPTRWFDEDYAPANSPTEHQELSYVLGVAFGRWDIRIAAGELEPPQLPGPYDPLPPASRGMLVSKDGLPARQSPVGYPLSIPPNRMLYDEPGHRYDLVAAIEGVIELLETGLESPKIALHREVSGLRRHLRGRFFPDHVKDYSASRRYAPIYWYLAVPSREWGLWVYAPVLSRETLFAVAGSAQDKLRRLREQARQLRDRHVSTTDRAVVERIEQVESLAGEIEQFAENAEKIAQSGWRPDINDGLILCAAPLESLFADDAWRRRVAQYRRDLEKKKYPWATVQREFFGGGS